tara:strand:- start:1054 stop:1239 length:186 start_codon:yes stop_codon:yes gene_type:complete
MKQEKGKLAHDHIFLSRRNLSDPALERSRFRSVSVGVANFPLGSASAIDCAECGLFVDYNK